MVLHARIPSRHASQSAPVFPRNQNQRARCAIYSFLRDCCVPANLPLQIQWERTVVLLLSLYVLVEAAIGASRSRYPKFWFEAAEDVRTEPVAYCPVR
jgi:hypothetical protein